MDIIRYFVPDLTGGPDFKLQQLPQLLVDSQPGDTDTGTNNPTSQVPQVANLASYLC